MTTGTWKLLILGGAAICALVVANVEVTSHPREYAVSSQSFTPERPATFETNLIYGSDASISTFGVDTGHTTDW